MDAFPSWESTPSGFRKQWNVQKILKIIFPFFSSDLLLEWFLSWQFLLPLAELLVSWINLETKIWFEAKEDGVLSIITFECLYFADALTEENILFLEAWRTIDRVYVDKTFNGQSWFRYRENALRNEPMNSREETCMLSVLHSHVLQLGLLEV